MYIYVPCECSACEDQKKQWDSLELQLEFHMGARIKP